MSEKSVYFAEKTSHSEGRLCSIDALGGAAGEHMDQRPVLGAREADSRATVEKHGLSARRAASPGPVWRTWSPLACCCHTGALGLLLKAAWGSQHQETWNVFKNKSIKAQGHWTLPPPPSWRMHPEGGDRKAHAYCVWQQHGGGGGGVGWQEGAGRAPT